jgi:hypothetical protein
LLYVLRIKRQDLPPCCNVPHLTTAMSPDGSVSWTNRSEGFAAGTVAGKRDRNEGECDRKPDVGSAVEGDKLLGKAASPGPSSRVSDV